MKKSSLLLVLVLCFASLLAFGPNLAFGGTREDVVSSFPSPNTEVGDIAWGGNYLWYVCYYYTSGMIYKLNPTTGAVVSSFGAPGYISLYSGGIAWDGTYLWVAAAPTFTTANTIYKLNPANGAVISSFSGPSSNLSGLEWDGTWLWVGDSGTDKIYKLNPSTGAVISSFNAPGGYWPSGLAWDGTYLWNIDQITNRVYKLNPQTGAVIFSFYSSNARRGLAWDGTYLWYAGDSTDTIYKINVITTYNLSTSVGSGSGSISLSPSGGVYDAGTTVTVTATPSAGYVFDHWSGDASGSSSSFQIMMNSNQSVIANFLKTTSLSISPSNFTVKYGETKTLTATLTSGGSPLAGKTISWSAISGSVYPWSSTTDYWGKASTTYTAPSYETSATITASFAGDSQYKASSNSSSGTVQFTVVFTFTKPDGSALTYTPIYYGTSEGRETYVLGTTDSSGRITSTNSSLAGYTLYFKSSDGAYQGSQYVSSYGGSESVTLESSGYGLWMLLLALLVVLGAVAGAAYWFKHKPRVTGTRVMHRRRPTRRPKVLKDETIAYIPVECPKCGAANFPHAKHCVKCGRKLKG